ncbi:MAG TPA: hypothetical protein VNL39_08915 [Xanthobacteraceae bacterium]|nr:hypothetical protein [Xanthobacteraceae bacterium]
MYGTTTRGPKLGPRLGARAVTAGAFQRRPAEPHARAAGVDHVDNEEGGDLRQDGDALDDEDEDGEDDDDDDQVRSRLLATSTADAIAALAASETFARGTAPASETPIRSAAPTAKVSLLCIAVPESRATAASKLNQAIEPSKGVAIEAV